ncbi:MAG: 3-keto-5-aminohexanoate cleavage protein [Candidatus Wallbacteria bacterium HGW-Wallbacteria-1]|jgi:3-keto-5-aminohexanoate cleavage enzyme|uniref:3-keto-5-aminohexanoate cleavage protein n=1 Tax=Candidatus Wallbacteria bacterium HGW-Wallbacteria-1 TaxID=2013854 RepID=A0A2N1PKZ0_9BACT|nr:MAG: 3-keto-5-aminohexanoate cleavage protein [Candidatus Wallbacteria bacterium HGW-Wallbacteria-1]
MKNKMVITAAICGAETTREHNPNLPLTPAELAQAAYGAWKAGAAIVHLHVRDRDGNATMDVEIFREAMKLIREKCDIVIEVTTGGGVGMSDDERIAVLELKPEMASLDCGTVNFGDDYIVNTLPSQRRFAEKMKEHGVRPTLECFDLSHVYAANILIDKGLVDPPYHFGFVMNVPGGVRYDVETLNFFVSRIPAGSNWTVMGIGGRASVLAHYGAVSLGGFIRVGFEDNVYFSRGVLAESNAQLVERAVRIATEAGLEIATPADVREALKLRGI